MKRILTHTFATLALLVSSTIASVHDDRLHGPNALTGEIVSASEGGFQLKTKAGIRLCFK